MCHYSEWLQKRFLASTVWWSFILLDHIQYLAWQILLYSNALWSYSCGWFFPLQARWLLWQNKKVIIIADDILILGYKPDHSNHDQAFTTLLQTAKKYNVKLNYDKLQYKQNEVEFFGETYRTSGCKPSKDKVAVITSVSLPTNKKQVQSIIVMINHLAKFSARLPQLAEPIRELVRDKVPFNWGPEHQAAVIQMKKKIVSAPILAHYNSKKQTMLQTDTSS